MERVAGLGGIFLRARDAQSLAAWYRDYLGLPIDEGQTYGTLPAAAPTPPGGTPAQMVWSVFPPDTEYLGSPGAACMVNYRVHNLDRMLAQLRAAGAWVDDRVEDHSYGRFGWAQDPEGNRFELWEPAGPGF